MNDSARSKAEQIIAHWENVEAEDGPSQSHDDLSYAIEKALNAYATEQTAALRAEVERLRAALVEIKRDQGKVCPNFELCHHESCRSSYTSWAIADAALLAAPEGRAREHREAVRDLVDAVESYFHAGPIPENIASAIRSLAAPEDQL